MVKTGQAGPRVAFQGVTKIDRRSYQPPASYKLDVEIIRMHDLRARTKNAHLERLHRIDFHMLICVTEGECAHVIDFAEAAGKRGSLFLLKPSQTEMFDLSHAWDGWLVLFRSDFFGTSKTTATAGNPDVISVLERFPNHFSLDEEELKTAVNSISQMRCDAVRLGLASELNALLRYQLSALILRLAIAYESQTPLPHTSSAHTQRFMAFKNIVDEKFAIWHKVRDYVDTLKCSEKTLNRASKQVTGFTAKEFISKRITLEAKRFLAHSTSRISAISDSLGFDEPTNFIKFFKRESGVTPAEFRDQQQGTLRG